MRIKIFIIFAVLLIFGYQTSANSLEIISVDVTSSQPLDTDLIAFNISGSASTSSSLVQYDQFSQNGTLFQLDLYVDHGILQIPSRWTYTKQIQPIPANNYTLQVRAFDCELGNTLQDTYNTGFTVTPEPSTLAIFGFALPFLRAFSGRKS